MTTVSVATPYPAVKSAADLFVFSLICVVVLRPFNKNILRERLPFLIAAASFLFFLGLGELPIALPHAFEKLLGHSIDEFDPVANGSWFEIRWTSGLVSVWLLLILIAVPWSIVNVWSGRSIRWNVAALAFLFVWAVFLFLAVTGHFIWYL